MELEQPNENITNQIENLKIKIENILQQRKWLRIQSHSLLWIKILNPKMSNERIVLEDKMGSIEKEIEKMKTQLSENEELQEIDLTQQLQFIHSYHTSTQG